MTSNTKCWLKKQSTETDNLQQKLKRKCMSIIKVGHITESIICCSYTQGCFNID